MFADIDISCSRQGSYVVELDLLRIFKNTLRINKQTTYPFIWAFGDNTYYQVTIFLFKSNPNSAETEFQPLHHYQT